MPVTFWRVVVEMEAPTPLCLNDGILIAVMLPEKAVNMRCVLVKFLEFVLGQFRSLGEKGDPSVGVTN